MYISLYMMAKDVKYVCARVHILRVKRCRWHVVSVEGGVCVLVQNDTSDTILDHTAFPTAGTTSCWDMVGENDCVPLIFLLLGRAQKS